MRMLFVSHVHPASGLVGGLRLYRFAQELAHRGHRVVLLCGSAQSTGDTAADFEARFNGHDWSTPLVLSVADPREPAVTHPALLHRSRTAYNLIVRGGPFWRWRRSALALSAPIRRLLQPQICYATFGNLDALAIARAIARQAGIPWVLDIKDAATSFLHPPLRRWLMRPYRDAAATTINAKFQRTHNPGWVTDRSTVVYSGVEVPPSISPALDPHRIALVGSVYDDDALATLLRGFAMWRQRSAGGATLHYMGANGERVATAAQSLDLVECIAVDGQLDRASMLTACAQMGALLYVRSQTGFHHKLLELAALGRPLIACPGEGDEATALARENGIELASCGSDLAIADALSHATTLPTADMTPLVRRFSWASVAQQLEDVLARALRASQDGAP